MGSLYSDQPTWLHGMSAGFKLLALALLGIGLFATQQWQVLLATAVVCVCVFASLGKAAQRTKPLLMGVWVASLLVAGFHLWMQQQSLWPHVVMRLN